jgi:hypothetical protein
MPTCELSPAHNCAVSLMPHQSLSESFKLVSDSSSILTAIHLITHACAIIMLKARVWGSSVQRYDSGTPSRYSLPLA